MSVRDSRSASASIELTVVLPCLNEAETVEFCIQEALEGIARAGIAGEVLVADNGSSDGTAEIAVRAGARVVNIPARGYGAALSGGIAEARGAWVVMGDADGSYDFRTLAPFIEQLQAGNDLVMGNRFRGGIEDGAMPPLHRYLGNPVLSFLGRLFFRAPVGDFHCGIRAFTRLAAQRMDLRTTGMEFASEMVVKAAMLDLRIAEVPTVLRRDRRSRPPHLRTWRDGWRHLRFLLIYSPRYLFLIPGLGAIAAGLIGGLLVWTGPRRFGTVAFDVHTLLFAGGAILLGAQSVFFAVFTKAFGITNKLLPRDARFERWLTRVRLETGIVVGILLMVIGLGFSIAAVAEWRAARFGALDPSHTMRLAIPAVVSLALGAQTILGSFFLSILGLQRSDTR